MKKRFLPRSTMIAGTKWTIKEKQRVRHEDGDLVHGQCIYETNTIEVNVSSGDESKILSTFYHEICHAAIHESGTDLPDSQEHAILACLEKWLVANTILKPKKTPKSKTTQEKAEDVTN